MKMGSQCAASTERVECYRLPC